MNSFYYAACPIPAICLMAAYWIFGPSNPGDPVPMANLILSDSTLILSPLLTLLGIFLISDAVAYQRSFVWPLIATLVSLVPGALLLMILNMPSN